MLARKVITRRGRRFRGYFPSKKLGRMVAWESLVERDVILLLEFSPGVLSYQEQPVLVKYHDGSDIRAYYPDFEVVFIDGQSIHVEVKTAKDLAKPVIQNKYRTIAADYARRQHGFRIISDQDLRCGALHKNLRMLASIHRMGDRPSDSRGIWYGHFKNEPVTFAMAEAQMGRAALLTLVASGIAYSDLRLPLDGETLVQLVREGGSDVTYLL
jgi:hypothetical protein